MFNLDRFTSSVSSCVTSNVSQIFIVVLQFYTKFFYLFLRQMHVLCLLVLIVPISFCLWLFHIIYDFFRNECSIIDYILHLSLVLLRTYACKFYKSHNFPTKHGGLFLLSPSTKNGFKEVIST